VSVIVFALVGQQSVCVCIVVQVVLAAVGSAFYQKYQNLTSVVKDEDAEDCDGLKLCEGQL